MARASSKTNPDESTEQPLDEEQSSTLGDFVRRMAYVGIGTAFATQETASRMVRDLKLPREAVGMIMQGMEKNREEMMKVASRAFSDYLQNLDMAHLLKSAMDGMNVKVSGEVQFNYDPKKKGKIDADIKASAKPGRRRRKKTTEFESIFSHKKSPRQILTRAFLL